MGELAGMRENDTGYWLLVACCLLLAASCWLLADGFWLLAAGSWLLAAGYMLHSVVSNP